MENSQNAASDAQKRIGRQNVLIARHQARKARSDMRDWAQEQRERTRHLIELGGLVRKAGLVELIGPHCSEPFWSWQSSFREMKIRLPPI